MTQLKTGAIAILDALGMKGVWDQYSSPENILEAFVEFREKLPLFLESLKSSSAPVGHCFDSQIAFASDTVIIGHCIEPEFENPAVSETANELTCLIALAQLCKCAVMVGAHMKIPFVFRGAFASGKLFMQQDIIVGPAVDSAASLYEKPSGAFIVGDHHTSTLLTKYAEGYGELSKLPPFPGDGPLPRTDDMFFCNYDVPTRSGHLRAAVINPIRDAYESGRQRVRESYIAKFSERDSPRVNEIRDNSLLFLDYAERLTQIPVPSTKLTRGCVS